MKKPLDTIKSCDTQFMVVQSYAHAEALVIVWILVTITILKHVYMCFVFYQLKMGTIASYTRRK